MGGAYPSALKYSIKMLATEHIETARQFLADADREYEAGDMLQASEKLWGAASHVVIAEMHRRGTKSSGHRAMILAVVRLPRTSTTPNCDRNSPRREHCTPTSTTVSWKITSMPKTENSFADSSNA